MGLIWWCAWCPGRASQRLTETSGRQAATIHRLLKWVPSNSQFDRSSSDTDKSADSKFSSGAGGHFKYNNQNPLTLAEEGVDEEYWKEVDAVLVDEASMLDLPLAAALLLALPPKCQLVFVGRCCLPHSLLVCAICLCLPACLDLDSC